LAPEFPERSHWLNQFVLRRIFHDHVVDDRAGLAFALVRRAEAALDEWELACGAVREGVRRPSAYFKALRHFESCLASLWQGLDLGRRALGTDLFAKGDGSVFERLNWLYNKARHFDPQSLPAGDLHALWITNDGPASTQLLLRKYAMRSGFSVERCMRSPEVLRNPKHPHRGANPNFTLHPTPLRGVAERAC
jgi:hypothetical protein